MAERVEPLVVRLRGRDVDLLGWRALGWVAVAAALAAYLTALIAQYGFGWAPCPLCLWQRVPYLVAFALAAPALLLNRAPALLLAGAAASFAVGAGLGVYHSLVEFGLLEGLASCSAGGGGVAQGLDLERFLAETQGHVFVDCGVRTPFFLGLTMGNWNALISADLAAVFGLAAYRAPR